MQRTIDTLKRRAMGNTTIEQLTEDENGSACVALGARRDRQRVHSRMRHLRVRGWPPAGRAVSATRERAQCEAVVHDR